MKGSCLDEMTRESIKGQTIELNEYGHPMLTCSPHKHSNDHENSAIWNFVMIWCRLSILFVLFLKNDYHVLKWVSGLTQLEQYFRYFIPCPLDVTRMLDAMHVTDVVIPTCTGFWNTNQGSGDPCMAKTHNSASDHCAPRTLCPVVCKLTVCTQEHIGTCDSPCTLTSNYHPSLPDEIGNNSMLGIGCFEHTTVDIKITLVLLYVLAQMP